nr:cmp-sialic acid transporter 2 [Quercus suber]
MVFNAVAIVTQDFDAVMNKGFFHGYSFITILMILNHALSGLAVSMVMKHADNIVKAMKGHVPTREMKQIQHPITSDHEKPQIVEKIADTPRFDHTKSLAIKYSVGKLCEQVVEDDFQVGKAWPTIVGAAKGRFRSIDVYSTSVAMLFTAFVCYFLFGFNLSVAFILGTITVAVSVYLHAVRKQR